MIKKISNLLYRYITLGADENTSQNDLKKITLLHIFCNTWYLFLIASFIEDFLKNKLILMNYLTIFSSTIIVQVLQYYKKFYIARLSFMSFIFVSVIYFSNYVYKGQLLEYFLLALPCMALIYIDNKKINILIFVVCLMVLYIPNLYFKHYPIPVLNNVNPPFLFLNLFIVMSYFKSLNIRNEKILEAKTRELEELDKFKSQFFTNISHEIRTPLTLINGHISDLDAHTFENRSLPTIQSGIKKQINIITNMVDNVLDLAKMRSSNFSLELKPINISELIQKHYLNFEPLFKQKNIAFHIFKNSKDCMVNIDVVFFEKAINNILTNALKYTDEGEVKITISKKNQHVHIAISDTGIGISKNDLKHVFDRFYQVNNDTNKSGGSGIGLAFSKEIIKLHNAQILLASELNVGSTFTIVLPLEKSIAATLVTPVDTTPVFIKEEYPLQQVSIESSHIFLVVDDNYDMRQYLISILNNYSCLEASNGLEALEIIKEKRVDFIITDYMMPKLNGYEFILKLKELNNNTPIIMLTAKPDIPIKLDVLKLGIDDYITKPFDEEELLIRIKNCIKNYTSKNSYNEAHQIYANDYHDYFITNLKQYIYKNSRETTLNQDILSEEFNISKSSFYRKVKSQTGLNPNNFIKEIRLQKAREILERNPTILLKQIALEVGYNHDTHFSKIYFKRFGVRPTRTNNKNIS
ncbi:response regulator [Flavivirga aquimarina]|uniref:histidine kinase n=1 Tax=Flavivirga aquimarina TaxID=2027862 RepID=A0ABT8W8I5_9FLAO|nr:response regulator [Flavivirga aquimarina]MDO5969452.1 response regulator [Flavivirga aquimarina]